MEIKKKIFENHLFIEKSTTYVSNLKSKTVNESDIPFEITIAKIRRIDTR